MDLFVPKQHSLFRPEFTLGSIHLRDYQQEAIDRISDLLKEGTRSICAVAPTGAGKTVMFSRLLNGAAAKGSPCLVLAHRTELLDQTYDKAMRSGIPRELLSVMQGKHRLYNEDAPVQIASVQTVARRRLPWCRLLIIDECHHARGAEYEKIIRGVRAADPKAAVLGFTATPVRLDGKGLSQFFEAMVEVTTPRVLMAQGFLVRPRVFTHPIDLGHVRVTREGEYDADEAAAAVDKRPLIGDLVAHWKRHAEGLRTVCFAASVAHSQHLVEAFLAAGIPAEHLDGTMQPAARAAVLARLHSGETLVVSNCSVLTEGFDEPSVKCVILARPTRSLSLYLQCVGRGLRACEGFDTCIVLDHAGCALEHGLPDDDRSWSLDGRTKRREAIAVRCCPKCFCAMEGGTDTCPACGYEFPAPPAERAELEHVEGELLEFARPSDEEAAASKNAEQNTALRRQIAAFALRTDKARGWDPGTTNRHLFRHFRKRREVMSGEQLAAVLAYCDGGDFERAHPRGPAQLEPGEEWAS